VDYMRESRSLLQNQLSCGGINKIPGGTAYERSYPGGFYPDLTAQLEDDVSRRYPSMPAEYHSGQSPTWDNLTQIHSAQARDGLAGSWDSRCLLLGSRGLRKCWYKLPAKACIRYPCVLSTASQYLLYTPSTTCISASVFGLSNSPIHFRFLQVLF